MKDEIPNATIRKLVVIKLSHFYETVNGEIEKNLKCLAKEINENQIDVDDYRNSVLANTDEIYARKMYVVKKCQICLDSFIHIV